MLIWAFKETISLFFCYFVLYATSWVIFSIILSHFVVVGFPAGTIHTTRTCRSIKRIYETEGTKANLYKMECSPCAPQGTSSSSAVPPQPPPPQPIYTTAGTIYKPNSSQPLQPPTRRGRSLKWPFGTPHSELALLPKSVLAGLPIKAPVWHALTPTRYTPLQQNYDRAVSPLGEQGQVMVKLPAGKAPPCSTSIEDASFSTDVDRRGQTTDNLEQGIVDADVKPNENEDDYVFEKGEEEDDDDEDEDAPKSLTKMAVKSIQNLASYDNPMQKKARKLLQRGVLPLSNGCMPPAAIPRLISPSTFRNDRNSPGHLESDALQRSTPFPRPALSNTAINPRKQRDSLGRPCAKTPEGCATEPLYANDQFRANTGLSFRRPPLPLTAGPPGQRQYRPSTFESTFKALNVRSPGSTNREGDFSHDALIIANQTLAQAGIRDVVLTTEELRSLAMPPNPQHAVETRLTATVSRGGGMPAGLALQNDMIAAAEKAKHQERINKYWYSGVNFSNNALAKAQNNGETASEYNRSFGALGRDVRPCLTSPQPQLQPADEVARRPICEDTQDIFEMAIAFMDRRDFEKDTARRQREETLPPNRQPSVSPIGMPRPAA